MSASKRDTAPLKQKFDQLKKVAILGALQLEPRDVATVVLSCFCQYILRMRTNGYLQTYDQNSDTIIWIW